MSQMIRKILGECPCKAAVEIEVQGTLNALTYKTKADGNWVSFKRIDWFTLSGGGTFDGLGPKVWGACGGKYCKELPVNLRFHSITNGLVKDIASKDSKQFHVSLLSCQNLEFQHFTISAPAESINTDGIHISRSSNISVTNSNIGTGDGCISIGPGTQQITITGVTCGPGHGISIEVLVSCRMKSLWLESESGVIRTFSNTDKGVRIKTWPASFEGSVTDVIYEGIVMNNVTNPIIIDQVYCPAGVCNAKGFVDFASVMETLGKYCSNRVENLSYRKLGEYSDGECVAVDREDITSSVLGKANIF
ncbi:hypothetical protein Dsin_014972 [Dipteronia sinensis]|uniref:Uncharacterized protein n=1 Tax=Dipteronia sinensis TaxID=43782 RepID=A0AAE0EAV0_9ROSI|nr:hypothetical protein Dsin_014972 [Dipteronia sinensis]